MDVDVEVEAVDLEDVDTPVTIITVKVHNVPINKTTVHIFKEVATQAIQTFVLVQEYVKASLETKFKIVKNVALVFVITNIVLRLILCIKIHLNLEEIFVMKPIKCLLTILNYVMIKM